MTRAAAKSTLLPATSAIMTTQADSLPPLLSNTPGQTRTNPGRASPGWTGMGPQKKQKLVHHPLPKNNNDVTNHHEDRTPSAEQRNVYSTKYACSNVSDGTKNNKHHHKSTSDTVALSPSLLSVSSSSSPQILSSSSTSSTPSLEHSVLLSSSSLDDKAETQREERQQQQQQASSTHPPPEAASSGPNTVVSAGVVDEDTLDYGNKDMVNKYYRQLKGKSQKKIPIGPLKKLETNAEKHAFCQQWRKCNTQAEQKVLEQRCRADAEAKKKAAKDEAERKKAEQKASRLAERLAANERHAKNAKEIDEAMEEAERKKAERKAAAEAAELERIRIECPERAKQYAAALAEKAKQKAEREAQKAAEKAAELERNRIECAERAKQYAAALAEKAKQKAEREQKKAEQKAAREAAREAAMKERERKIIGCVLRYGNDFSFLGTLLNCNSSAIQSRWYGKLKGLVKNGLTPEEITASMAAAAAAVAAAGSNIQKQAAELEQKVEQAAAAKAAKKAELEQKVEQAAAAKAAKKAENELKKKKERAEKAAATKKKKPLSKELDECAKEALAKKEEREKKDAEAEEMKEYVGQLFEEGRVQFDVRKRPSCGNLGLPTQCASDADAIQLAIKALEEAKNPLYYLLCWYANDNNVELDFFIEQAKKLLPDDKAFAMLLGLCGTHGGVDLTCGGRGCCSDLSHSKCQSVMGAEKLRESLIGIVQLVKDVRFGLPFINARIGDVGCTLSQEEVNFPGRTGCPHYLWFEGWLKALIINIMMWLSRQLRNPTIVISVGGTSTNMEAVIGNLDEENIDFFSGELCHVQYVANEGANTCERAPGDVQLLSDLIVDLGVCVNGKSPSRTLADIVGIDELTSKASKRATSNFIGRERGKIITAIEGKAENERTALEKAMLTNWNKKTSAQRHFKTKAWTSIMDDMRNKSPTSRTEEESAMSDIYNLYGCRASFSDDEVRGILIEEGLLDLFELGFPGNTRESCHANPDITRCVLSFIGDDDKSTLLDFI